MLRQKNNKTLINIIQSAVYLLKMSDDQSKWNNVDKKFFRDIANPQISFLKKEMKKLKRHK